MSSNNKKLQKALKVASKPTKNPKSWLTSKDVSRKNLGADTKMIVNNGSVVDNFGWRREKVADVLGTAAFTSRDYYLNPGNSVLFPVTSRANSIYEEYEMDVEFDYEPVAYTAIGTTASPGLVVMVTNYDSSDPAFTSLTAAENYDHSVRLLPFERGTHVVRSKTGRMRGYPLGDYFVANTPNLALPTTVTTGEKFYNLGRFSLITDNNAITDKIGELYVRYRRKMIRQKQTTNPDAETNLYAHLVGVPTTAAPGAGLTAQTGNTFVPTFNNSLLYFPYTVSGRFLITWHIAAATSATIIATITASSQTTAVNYFTAENSGDTIVSGSGTTALTIMSVFDVQASVLGSAAGLASITMPTSTIVGAGVSSVVINAIPASASYLSSRSILLELQRNMKNLLGRKEMEIDEDFENCESELSSSIQLDLKKVLQRLK